MFNNNSESQILPFFYSGEMLDHTAFNYDTFESYDGFNVFVVGSLYGSHIGDLHSYLQDGMTEVRERFNNIDLPILDRMKASIFQSGDYLANHLMEAKEVVDDVDFSVCIVAFKQNIVYVWIDGDLNVRIYRGGESILINSDHKPQFNGSTNVELGDIFAISYSSHLEEHDEHVEDYVLEQQAPAYQALFIDYQVEAVEHQEAAPVENVREDHHLEKEADLTTLASLNDENEDADSAPLFKKPQLNFDASKLKENFSQNIAKLKESNVLQKVLDYLKKGLGFVFGVLMGITSAVLDFIYKVILRKNQHQVKRFQSSYQKKNMQYLLILVILVFSTYALFFTPGDKSSATTKTNGSAAVKSQQDIKTNLQSEFDKLTQYYNSVQVSNFSATFSSFKQQVSSARAGGFSEVSYLNQLLDTAQSYEDTLFKVTPIKKVDDVFFSTNIQNVKLVDFSVLGEDVYAIDRANAQVLKSAPGQQFEVFAADPRLAAMTQIVCADGSCYILDEARGLAVLSIAKKTFEIFPNTTAFSAGVKESLYAFNRIYTMVPGELSVKKYDKQGPAFTAGSKWNVDSGFGTSVSDFTIDGNIFELSAGGAMRKFYQGKNDVSFGGLEESNPRLGARLQMAVTPARDPGPNVRNRMYVADSDNQMIAVYDKDINTNKQFPFKGVYKYRGTDKITFENIDEIDLSADEQSLYMMGNNTVYKIRVTTL